VLYDFRFNIIFRVALIVAFAAAMALAIQQSNYLTAAFFGLLLALVAANIITYANQTNRDLANFFASIQYDDYTATASAAHKGRSFGELYRQFNFINKKFQDIRAEKEANHHLLQTIVEHIQTGLLGVDDEGRIVIMNKALQGLLHKSYLVDVEHLRQIDEQLHDIVRSLAPQERALLKPRLGGRPAQLSVQVVELILQRRRLRLFSFTNVRSELEEQEVAAWQKLIRILTHEIMNSVAPIASLSATLHDFLARQNNGANLEEEDFAQIKSALAVIQRRGEGLLKFTETYRTLSRIPPPQLQLLDARRLVESVVMLFQPRFTELGIHCQTHFPPHDIVLEGDAAQLEQVLINLIKNAVDALEERENPRIDIHLQRPPSGQVLILIADNGPGIPPEQLEQIFVPFYTTKKDGSGIGLSLSRQIVQMHKGSLDVQSTPEEGTAVWIRL
jgi:two-component system nitrogen regulation sensor histidine kinase NtrY